MCGKDNASWYLECLVLLENYLEYLEYLEYMQKISCAHLVNIDRFASVTIVGYSSVSR